MNTISDALDDLKAGKIVILVDDEDRENEGDLVIAAEKVTKDAINFMAKYGRGLICLAMDENYIKKLKIPMMVSNNTAPFKTAFTVSIDASKNVSTGISASDRAATVQTAIKDDVKPEDIVMPGHIFPLKAEKGGVLVRAGQTEGSVDLARLAGMKSAGVICEIMNEDGTMARLSELKNFAMEHDLKIISIADLIAYRLNKDLLIKELSSANLPTRYGGDFRIKLFKDIISGEENIALIKGDPKKCNDPVWVRVHSECITGEIFGSLRCDCGDQLRESLRMIADKGSGVLLYMKQEGRGIGLANKIKAYSLQDSGDDTVSANKKLGYEDDLRDYGIGAQILRFLGLKKICLLTNNPRKISGIQGYGLEIVKRVPIEIKPNNDNIRYLKAKKKKMGHLLNGI